MKKGFKLLKYIFITIVFISFAYINTKAWTRDCDEVSKDIDDLQEKYFIRCSDSESYENRVCRTIFNELEAAKKWKKDNCNTVSCVAHPFTDQLIGPGLDQSGYVIHKYTYNGTGAFCIEPDQAFKCFRDYEVVQGKIDNSPEVAKIVKAFEELGGINAGDDLYRATQLYIWDKLGLDRTINGGDKLWNLRSQLDSKIAELEAAKTPQIPGAGTIEYNKLVTLTDVKGILAQGGYELESAPSNVKDFNIDGNNISFRVEGIYPTLKNFKIKLRPTKNSVSELIGNRFVASDSQDLFSFNGPLGTFYSPIELDFSVKTGDMKITKIDEFGNKIKSGVSFNLYFGTPFDGDSCEKGDQIFKEDGSDWITDDNSEIYIKDRLPKGCYVIEEKKTLDSYIYDGQPHSILVNDDEITYFTMKNDNRNVSLKIKKLENETDQPMDGATFIVYDITKENKPEIENGIDKVNDYIVPLKADIQKTYFLKVGQSVDLNILFQTSNKKYTIIEKDLSKDFSNENIQVSYNKASTLQNNILTAKRVGKVEVRSSDDNYLVYLMPDNDTLSNDPYYSLDSITIFKGISGHRYFQSIDYDNHNMPLANSKYKLFNDENAQDVAYEYETDSLGLFDYSDIIYENDFYHYDVDKKIKRVTKEELNSYEEGSLTIPYLKAGRDYLVCELNPNENYVVKESPCKKVSTYEDNYPKDVDILTFTFYNEKGKGDLNIIKLNEWLENKGSGNQFQIYKAKLKDEDLPYYKNYQNIALDENGKPIKEAEAIDYNGTNIFTINDENSYPIIDHLTYGYYIIKEIKTTDMYTDNEDEYLLYIAYSKLNNLEFINNNRNVSITLTKKDLEENFRKINDAGYVLYDISKTLDHDIINTNYGYQNIENLKLDNKDITNSLSNYYKRNIIEKENNLKAYPLENLYFIKTNKTIDLRKFLIESDDKLNEELKNLPIVWKLEGGRDTTIDINNQLVALEPTMFNIKAYGGKYELYGTIDNPKIYQNELFDPYEDLKFYTSNNIKDELEVKELSYITKKDSKDLDITKIGKYEITYTLISKDGTLYNFDRTIEVIKDERNLPSKDENDQYYIQKDGKKIYLEYDVEKEKFYYLIDNKEVYLNEYDALNDKRENKIIPIILNEQKIPKDYVNKELGNWIIRAEGNNDLFKEDTQIKKALKLQKAKTGTSFIQTINELNHNLYLPNQEIVLYFDQKLEYPIAILNTDEMGEIALNNFGIEKIEDENKKIEYLFKNTNPNIKLLSDKFNYIKNNDGTFTIKTFEKELDNTFKPIDKIVDELPNLSSKLYYASLILKDKVYEIDMENINQDGILTFNNLKFDRKYLLCEEKLPEGYDYLSDGNTCMYLDTNEYQENEDNKNHTLYNKKRRVDLVLYKTNAQKAIKLDGAVFDVWNISEEGKDLNDLTNEIKVKVTKDNLKLIDKPLGKSTEGSCKLYQNETNDLVLYPISDKNRLFIYDENKKDIEGICYQKYEPTLINRSYLGRYVTGGIYLKTSLKNHDIGLYSDPLTKNLLKIVKTDDNGEISILGLTNGIYYTKPIRPLKNNVELNLIDDEGRKIIRIPAEDDYVSYDDLDPIYKIIEKHYVSKGMIYLPEIKYGSDILFKEIKAPSGYYFDDSNQVIKVKTSYGIKRMENYRINNVIRIPNLGVRE